VFQSQEGRLIGEAEGKDNRAINVDKLRQLAMNIHEDLSREDVREPAKPVLFGNGQRLTPVEARDQIFTAKCIAAAQATSTALVSTTDLFRAVQHVLETGDAAFAADCRKTILLSTGPVAFPRPTTDHPDAGQNTRDANTGAN
jgi:hypothetical protein